MTTGDSEADVDWSLLPRDPVGFFALEAGFDRRDLKRHYNRLLRRFKPEKHPEEFQRIRAAYEELERELRYGQQADVGTEQAWSRPARSASPSRVAGVDTGEATLERSLDASALAERIERGEDLKEIYGQLQRLQPKAPQDYYSLALLSDAIEPGSGERFLGWLLEGLRAWPGDTTLGRLVCGFLSGQVPDADLPKVLVACSKAVSNDGFYALTEGAWDRLLRGRSFATFLDTLRKCEANLSGEGGDGSISGRVAFYIHALRFAMWRDPTEWKQGALDYVEEHFDQAPPHLENDLDILGVIQDYMTIRERFVASHELCRRMDSVLESVFTGDPVVADQEMVSCQLAMLEDPEEVSEAFRHTDQEVNQKVYPLWAWVANDAAARLAEEPPSVVDYRLWRERIRDLLHRLNNRLSDSATGIFWGLSLAAYGISKFSVYIACLVLLCFLPFILMGLKGEEPSEDGVAGYFFANLVLIVLPSGAVGYKILLPFLDETVWYVIRMKFARRSYRKLWRKELLEFLDRSLLDYYAFRTLIEEASDQFESWAWINTFVQQDGAMAVYSLAQRFKS